MFERFFRTYYPQVRSWVLGYLGYQDDVEDVIVEVMMAAWGKFETLENPTWPLNDEAIAWLRVVSRHKAVDHLRRTNPTPVTDETFEQLTSHTPATEDTAEVNDMFARAMRPLSVRQREILARTIAGFSTSEIAAMLGYSSESAVRAQLYRARRTVREFIDATPPSIKRPSEPLPRPRRTPPTPGPAAANRTRSASCR